MRPILHRKDWNIPYVERYLKVTSETHLLQNFVQGLSFDDVVQSHTCLLFTLVCQLQSVWLDKTSMKLPDLWRDFQGFMAQDTAWKKLMQANLQTKTPTFRKRTLTKVKQAIDNVVAKSTYCQ